MISYRPTKFRDLVGTYNGTITAVDVSPNNWGKPEDLNYVDSLLEVTFVLDFDPTEKVTHVQKFIKPLTGNGLFQQLLDVLGEIPDVDGGEFDEQSLVGLSVMVTMGKNAKGYNNVDAVAKGASTPKSAKAPAVKKAVEEDLPDFLKD